jgi:hypothetical protein
MRFSFRLANRKSAGGLPAGEDHNQSPVPSLGHSSLKSEFSQDGSQELEIKRNHYESDSKALGISLIGFAGRSDRNHAL